MDAQYRNFLNDMRHTLSPAQVVTDELRTLAWGTDASFYRMTPRVVVFPHDEEQMQQVMAACARWRLPFTFRAAGTSLSGQAVSNSVLIVAGRAWCRCQVSPDGSTVALQPGLVGAEVNRRLRPLGRVFPPDPASIGSAMVGGIVANNASGMNCGVHANSDRMMVSARLILADGTLVDTADASSRAQFAQTHATLLDQLAQLRDEVRADEALCQLIRRKYSIKNVTGLNLRPLVAYDDPLDIMAHLMAGSEGTLAFVAEVRMRTLCDYPHKASAMVYFHSMEQSCRAVVELKKMLTSDDDLRMSAEQCLVKSAEMLDYLSLQAVEDAVYLDYRADVDAGRVPGVAAGDYSHLTALLLETKAADRGELMRRVAAIEGVLAQYDLYRPARFTDDPAEYSAYWAIRSGIFPRVGGMRPKGTSCLIEDVAFPVEVLPEATVRLQRLISDHGYHDACIYGHALEGNYHFILNQSFSTDAEVARYERMMRDVARLVVEEYGGSLKAEHGTGRNMAPFVRYEWGDRAYGVMQRLKHLFDPQGLLNPGVIFNDDPQCFVKDLKPLPILSFSYGELPDSLTAREAAEGAEAADRCIECGFCEVNCVSCGLTLSARMRIAVLREILSLEKAGQAPERARRLRRIYRYWGNQTCAADGLCATSCPMRINTGHVTHVVRQLETQQDKTAQVAGRLAAKHLGGVEQGLRGLLAAAEGAHSLLGDRAMALVAGAMHRMGAPLWTTAMPHARRKPVQPVARAGSGRKVVYFPSCINQTMGLAKGTPVKNSLVEEMCLLLHKAGYDVLFPKKMAGLCCGQIWESKGMMEVADRKSQELEAALWEASEGGRWPILCDQSPCLHRMRKTVKGLKLYEPVEFILTFLRPYLDFHPLERPVAVHVTCSTRLMGLADRMVELARLCSTRVYVPEGVGCCGFAGDKGFTHPELNRHALRRLRPQLEEHGIERGYSNSRTCEVGLQANGGIPYMSIAYLVNECTVPQAAETGGEVQ